MVLPLADLGKQPPFQTARALDIVAARPLTACEELQSPVRGGIALLLRGDCTFLLKIQNAVAAGAKGVIIVNNDTDCLQVSADPEQLAKHDFSDVFVLTMLQQTGADMLGRLRDGDGLTATLRTVRIRLFNPACVVLLALALATLVVGSVWSGRDYNSKLSARFGPRPSRAPLPGQETVELTAAVVVSFVSMATVMMFVLFYLLNQYTFYVILALFAWGSLLATATSCHTVLNAVSPDLRLRPLGVPYLQGITYDWLVAAIPSTVLVLTWLVFRRASWAWIIQNFLGMNFMVLAMRTIQLPNTAVASLFLGLLFLYDIFMVFVTPLFMPHGESVMVRVAKGGSSNEIMPMLLVIPRFFSALHGLSMLGYGDVVVPGLLLALLRRFDVALGSSTPRGYFLPVLVSYAVGLLLTYAALEFEIGGSHGQPALLYLVPCTLGTTLALSAWRGDFWELWRGELEDDKDSGSDPELGGDGADTATSAGQAAPDSAVSETTRLL